MCIYVYIPISVYIISYILDDTVVILVPSGLQTDFFLCLEAHPQLKPQLCPFEQYIKKNTLLHYN